MSTTFPSSSIVSFTELATSITELNQAHAHMLKTSLIHNTFAASRLIAATTTLSPAPTQPQHLSYSYSHSIFSHLETPNSYTYNTLIRAYANSPTPQNAINLFAQMLHDEFVVPDKYTFTFVLKGCAGFKGLEEGKQVFGHVLKYGFGSDVYLQNSLIHLFAKCGCFVTARKLLDRMISSDVISWNGILNAYVEMGMMDLASELFDEMPERNLESWNFMISGYVSAGLMEKARSVFDEMPIKNVVSWNAMMTGYAHANCFNEVLILFESMQNVETKPDSCTLVNVLSACARLAALSQGEWVHAYIDKNEIKIDGFLANAMIDMYTKCGNVERGLRVFNETLNKDVSTWNSIITGLSMHGSGKHALEIFAQMLAEGYKPNEITFIGLLSACSRAGLLKEGREIFHQMVNVHEIEPMIEHYGCMVDLLGRCGLLEEAEQLLSKIPVKKEVHAIWESLLSACKKHNKFDMAKAVARKMLELNPKDSAGYVQLSNMYASMGKWKNVNDVRKRMKAQSVSKEPGCSIIEVDGVVHEFLAGEGVIS